jgi:hypothetical protein
MARSSGRFGHRGRPFFGAAHNRVDIVLFSMLFVFRGTLIVLSLVPGANTSGEGIPCSHPQNPGLSAHPSRRSARNGVLLSLSAVRYSFRLHRFPGPSGLRIPRPFGQPVPALGTERRSP